jgi:uncharacterized protein
MSKQLLYDRWFADSLRKKLERPYVHMMFGAHQTGKSTLLRSIMPEPSLVYDFSHPRERSRLLADPGLFNDECRALPARKRPHVVFVDEAQAVPEVFSAVQNLYDADKRRWRFILCGSSARKLRATGTNLLPGRSFLHRLYPLTMIEHPTDMDAKTAGIPVLRMTWSGGTGRNPFPSWGLEERLAFGSLPGIVAAAKRDRADALMTYATAHLEEEMRREALVRDWGAFVRFMHLAARESGAMLNFASISQETGISQPTVKNYYQLMEDMFIGFRVPAYSGSPRKRILSTPKFLFFDLGVRHAAAGLAPSIETVRADPGPVFEQWVGIEIWKRLQYLGGSLLYQRTQDGAEIDFIVERGRKLTPIEVKWTERPSPGDARHLISFLDNHRSTASHGWIVCRCRRPLRLEERITALPWWAF